MQGDFNGNLLHGHLILRRTVELCLRYAINYHEFNIAVIRFINCSTCEKHALIAAEISTAQKIKSFQQISLNHKLYTLNFNTDPDEFGTLIESLNADRKVLAILIQNPIPNQLLPLVSRLVPSKDIDNVSLSSNFKSCSTAESVKRVLNYYLSISKSKVHKIAVVGGRGFVGKNIVRLLEESGLSHFIVEQDDDLNLVTTASVIISAANKPNIIGREYFLNAPMIIDVGFFKDLDMPGKFTGNFKKETYSLAKVATPVPNGIGPLNVATILERVLILSNCPFDPWSF